MLTQKSKNKYENYFLGGYISNLIDNPDKSYVSISMKSFNDESSKTIFIMVYRKAGYGDNKYTNPMVKIVKDAFEKHIPILTAVITIQHALQFFIQAGGGWDLGHSA